MGGVGGWGKLGPGEVIPRERHREAAPGHRRFQEIPAVGPRAPPGVVTLWFRLFQQAQQHRPGFLLHGQQLAEFILGLLELRLLLLRGGPVGRQLGLHVVG